MKHNKLYLFIPKLTSILRNTIFMLIIFLLFTHNALAELIAHLDKKTADIDEPIKLIITKTEDINTPTLDLTFLTKDFEVLGTVNSTSYNIINGKTSSTHSWYFTLKAKHTGKIEIPAIEIGKEKTLKQIITITASLNNHNVINSKTKNTVFIKILTKPKRPYINEQVTYTVQLYNQVQLFNGHYMPPETDSGLIFPLGQSRHSTTTIDDEEYFLEEQDYAMFPQQSGKVTINPPKFEGVITNGLAKNIQIIGDKVDLNVKSALAKQNWLPIQDLSLTENYTSNNEQFTIGETIVRSITTTALGMPAQLMPTINHQAPANANFYQDEIIVKNSIKDNLVLGETTTKFTYALSHTGDIILPKIEYQWFDLRSQTFKTATLAERHITVLPKKINHNNVMQSTTEKNPGWNLVSNTQTVIIFLLILSQIITIYIWLFKPKWRRKDQWQTNIKHACDHNDAQACAKAILYFAEQKYKKEKFITISDVARYFDDPNFNREITILYTILYESKSTNWQGNKLWEAFKNLSFKPKKPKKPKNKKSIPELY